MLDMDILLRYDFYAYNKYSLEPLSLRSNKNTEDVRQFIAIYGWKSVIDHNERRVNTHQRSSIFEITTTVGSALVLIHTFKHPFDYGGCMIWI